MTQPRDALPEPGPAAGDVVEFGSSDRPAGRSRRLPGPRDPRTGWVLGGLGAVALFASLVGEWATITYRWGEEQVQSQTFVVGAGTAGAWGTAWMVGALALVAAVGLCAFGPDHLRGTARAAGLAVAGALLLLLVAAAIDIGSGGAGTPLAPTEYDTGAALERGLYAAYLAVALFAAALWLAPTDRRSEGAPVPAQPGWEPAHSPGGDLTVRPAEPIAHPIDDHEWR